MKDLINDKSTTIVDVRTPEEFAEGHAEGSINIPLNDVMDSLDRFKSMEGPIVLCCRSGMRSQQAMEWLEQQGVENMHNAGGYTDVVAHQEN